jgi:hypothetical protein
VPEAELERAHAELEFNRALATIETKVEILTSVEELVYGHIVGESISPYGTPDEVIDETSAHIGALIAGGEFPNLAALAEDGSLADTWRRIEAKLTEGDRFERALSRLLDGIERDLSS